MGDGLGGNDDTGDDPAETCGRCAMTSVVGVTASEPDRGSDSESGRRSDRGPFDGARIELSDRDLRLANAPAVALGLVKRRLDAVATRLTYGR